MWWNVHIINLITKNKKNAAVNRIIIEFDVKRKITRMKNEIFLLLLIRLKAPTWFLHSRNSVCGGWPEKNSIFTNFNLMKSLQIYHWQIAEFYFVSREHETVLVNRPVGVFVVDCFSFDSVWILERILRRFSPSEPNVRYCKLVLVLLCSNTNDEFKASSIRLSHLAVCA